MWCDLPKIVNMKCTPEVYSHIQTIQNLMAATETLISPFIWRDFQIGPSIRLVSLKVLKYVFSQNYVCMQEVRVCICRERSQSSPQNCDSNHIKIFEETYLREDVLRTTCVHWAQNLYYDFGKRKRR